MVVAHVRLKGLNRVAKRLADGRRIVYWYAWKGGPRLEGQPGSPEFVASYNAAVAARKTPKTNNLAGLVQRYRGSPEFNRNAETTKAEWRRWLKRIEEAEIATLSWEALNDREVRSDLMEWRDTFADRPRTADYAVQVLSRVLGWSKDRGLLKENHMLGVATLSRANHADQIWTDEEIAAFCAVASPEVGRALRLACYTGLRRADLIALTWDDVGELVIVKPTSKSRGQKVATVVLIDEAKQVLAEIEHKTGHVLLNTRGQPWNEDGLENRIIKFKKEAKVQKRLHDARGTFATRLRLAGLTKDDIATQMGWEGDKVERILNRYVDQRRFIESLAERMKGNKG